MLKLLPSFWKAAARLEFSFVSAETISRVECAEMIQTLESNMKLVSRRFKQIKSPHKMRELPVLVKSEFILRYTLYYPKS
jgi:hypothetical protein